MFFQIVSVSSPKITSVTASNDLVTVKSTGNVVGYYYGNSPKLNDAKYTSTTSNTFYASVKNGVYYFWVSGSGINGGNVSPVMYANGVKVSTSCTSQSVNNCDGSGVIERCYVYTGGNSVSPDKTGVLVTPKDGYKVTSLVASSNNCSNLSLVVGGQRLAQRYCKVTFTFKCEPKKTEPAKTDCTTNPNAPECKPACTGCACDNSCATTPYLTNISVSPGILSPAFSTKTTGYTVKVDGTVDKITINATGSKGNASGTISGTGTKQLSYGSQTFKVSISNNAGTTTYNVEVIRENNKSKDNSLKSLSINNGNLNPAFSPTQYKYNVEVENDK